MALKFPSIVLMQQSLAFLNMDMPALFHLYQWELTEDLFAEVKVEAKRRRISGMNAWEYILSERGTFLNPARVPLTATFMGRVFNEEKVLRDRLLEQGIFTEPLLLAYHQTSDKNGRNPRNWVVLTMKWDKDIVLMLSRYYMAVARHALKEK